MIRHGDTWLENEMAAYTPFGTQRRRGRARWEDGKIRAVRAGIADTFFTVPAHGRLRGKYVSGLIVVRDSEFRFLAHRKES